MLSQTARNTLDKIFFPNSKKLDETTAELKKTSVALEAEKHKTETLLNEMLPRKVAHQLKMGNRVDAGNISTSIHYFQTSPVHCS